jgi:3',5'-cyclic AMP phosphodiesterase CpdA
MLIAQVTDPHIKAAGQLAYRQVDTAANLARCIGHLLGLKRRPDLVLMTGDLTDFGREEEYRLLRELIAPLPMPVYVIPGNHDERENFRRAFHDHRYLPVAGKLHYVIDDYPIRMIGLDTTIAGKSGGEVDAACLAWLTDCLVAAPERPTLLFMHHPPIISGIEHMDVQNCANAAEFGNLLRKHPQVCRIVCGHVHRPIHTHWNGLIVSIAPSASHYVALDLGEAPHRDFYLEPPSIHLHSWHKECLVTHLSFVGDFAGPYPFYDELGRLID